MLDKIQILLWSITYILIIIFSYSNGSKRQIAIPITAVILNFSWEFVAFVGSGGYWAHTLWLFLDLAIVAYSLYSLKHIRKVIFAIICCIALMALVTVVCLYVRQGMLISCFAIDLIMAVSFWWQRKNLLAKGKVIIAITKLLGDLAAWMYYAPKHKMVFVMGLLVFIVNTAYLIYSVIEKKQLAKYSTGQKSDSI